ncbi:MAG: hypothetical protein R2748_25345 [Bryobacterales bacterium]
MTRSSAVMTLALLALGATAQAQVAPWQDPAQAISFETAPETGLTVASKDLSETRIYPRGTLAVIDLRCRLTLENRGAKPVRGVTLAVESQQSAAGGRASVAAPSLHAARGETFSVNLNLRLVRPLPGVAGPLVAVSVDGVLHDDMTFAGPNRLESQRKLTLLEAEARAAIASACAWLSTRVATICNKPLSPSSSASPSNPSCKRVWPAADARWHVQRTRTPRRSSSRCSTWPAPRSNSSQARRW